MAHSLEEDRRNLGAGHPLDARKPRLRIADLAEHLGLTKGTVSRALNGYSDISESTRLRVRNAAEEMGYRPLSHAQAIRTGKARSIGLILQVDQQDGHRPFLARFLAGVSEAASERGWTLTLATAQSDADAVKLLEAIAHDRKADGFILPRTKLEDPRIHALRSAQIPFVLYGRTRDGDGCAWYDIESEHAMADAVQRLAGLGHRRIGFVPGLPGYTYAKLRRQGYEAGLAKAGLAFDPVLVADPALTPEAGAEAARQLIGQGASALVYAIDQAALGAYEAARDLDLTMGEDISVIGYEGIPEGARMAPPLSTYAVDNRQAGARLTAHLLHLIAGEPPEAHRELARATFLDRGSHGPLASRPARAGATHHAQKSKQGGRS